MSSSDQHLDERKSYYSNNLLKTHEFFRAGYLEGERKSWHQNGNPWEQEFYRDGYLEGERKAWHYKGQLMIAEMYKNGKKEGERKAWNDSGRIERRGFYRNGQREGCHKFWLSDGSIYAHVIYEYGKVTKQYRYPQNTLINLDWEIANYPYYLTALPTCNFSFQNLQILLRLKTKLQTIGNLEKYQILSAYLITDLMRIV